MAKKVTKPGKQGAHGNNDGKNRGRNATYWDATKRND